MPVIAPLCREVGAIIGVVAQTTPSPEPPFPPADWLERRVTVSDIENGAGLPFNNGDFVATTADGRIVPRNTTVKEYSDWKRIELRMLPTDQLWTFNSPVEHWQRLAGRMGVALIRSGHPIGHVITVMN